MTRSPLLLATLAVLALSRPLPAAEDLQIGFDEQGLASIVHNGVELMRPVDRRFRLQSLRFVDTKAKEGVRQVWDPRPTAQSFDSAKRVLTQEYDGFRVECTFTTTANRLDLQITLANNAVDAIRECVFFPLQLTLPHVPENDGAWHHPGDFAGHRYVHGKGTVGLISHGTTAYLYLRDAQDGSRPLYLAGPRPESRPHHPLVDDSYWYDPGSVVPPGKTATYRVSLVFGPPETTLPDLAPEAYAAYAKANPMRLDWPDRRPIATAFLCNPATGWKTNPRGYFQDPQVDVTTEAGRKAFGERLMQYADNCINRMRKMDAQGIIVWDIEGQEMPHMISYIGDPRPLAKLSPEMDRFADAFMQKFRDAGFRTGVTIRPTEVYQPNQPGKLPWDQREVKDPVATMSEKIKVAQQRWGCTIFYLDSNVFGDGLLTPEQKKEMRGIPWIMPLGMFEKLAGLHPDCLISPEWAEPDHCRFGAPYSSPNLGQGGTDPLIRRLWPKAFRLVAVSQGLMEKRWEQYADSVAAGDVLLFQPWWDPAENTFVQLLYREAAIRQGGALAALAEADAATLAKQATAPAEELRYAAAAALGKRSTPHAVAALTGLLQDESPLVRKQALAALAQARRIDDPACVHVLTEWIKGSRDPIQNALRGFAADALARAGDAAVPALLDLLADDQAAGAWPYAVRALGRTATADARAGQVLIGWLSDAAPAKVPLRGDVIEALGPAEGERCGARALADP